MGAQSTSKLTTIPSGTRWIRKVKSLTMPAIATPHNISGMVSIVTPTYNRGRFLQNALVYFRHQNYENIEWLVLDDSSEENAAFGDLNDRNIFYERINGKLSIGEKRNILIEK